jgi:hypothetical protein
MTEPRKPTKAMVAVLRWMVAKEVPGEPHDWCGGDLINYYIERKIEHIRAEHARRGEECPSYMLEHVRGGYANHGFRRVGGTVLMNMERFGLVRRVGSNWGTPLYRMTDAGRQAGT